MTASVQSVNWPGDDERRRRLSLFHEGEDKRLRPGALAVLAAARAAVAAPWEGPAAEILNDTDGSYLDGFRDYIPGALARRGLALDEIPGGFRVRP